MIDVFRSLKSLLKISRTHIDNSIFALHYTVTVIILLVCCVIITRKQYVGEPIDCVVGVSGIPVSVVNTYCWIHTTYTVPTALHKKVGKEVVAPGVDNSQDETGVRYHRYFQWVCFVLLFQATLFYIPRWLWKMWEGGRISALSMDLDIASHGRSEREQKKKILADYLLYSKGTHDWYAARFFLCELLALGNVVGQMFMLDRFFDGEFWNYGFEVLEFLDRDDEERVDPMVRIFPRVTKCKFYMYGPSANIQHVDSLCLLPLNIINEKVYIVLWFWFYILGGLTAITILFHLVLIACPPVRVYVLNMRFRLTHLDHIHTIVRKTSIGDWFLIYMIGNNVDSVIYRDMIEDLACSSDGSSKDREPLSPV